MADYDRRLGVQSYPHVNARDIVTRVPPARLGFYATASAKTRQFPGPGHELKQTPAYTGDAVGEWRSLVLRSIDKATAFLPSTLRPRALRAALPPPPTANLYSARFERGPLDDHGSFEYLFKLVCASIEYDLWPIETSRSAEGSPDRPRN